MHAVHRRTAVYETFADSTGITHQVVQGVLGAGCARGASHPERQCLSLPTEELDGALSWRGHPLSAELAELAQHAGALLRGHHTWALCAGSSRKANATRIGCIAKKKAAWRGPPKVPLPNEITLSLSST